MKFWFAVFLGLVQGITEFLPVSSTGHLSILQNVLGVENVEQSHLLFDVLLHFGTLIAVCFVYRSDIKELIREFAGFFRRAAGKGDGKIKSRSASRLLLLIIIATLPLFAAVLLKNYIEKLFYNTLFIGAALIVTGFLLFASDRVPRGGKTEKNVTLINALTVGIMQALAVVPGLSRSGSTIAAGLFQGFDREFAVKFSFLLSIPAVLGASIISLVDALKQGINVSFLPSYLAGLGAAAISGYFAIKFVRYIARKDRFGSFAYYCWAVGLLTIIITIMV